MLEFHVDRATIIVERIALAGRVISEPEDWFKRLDQEDELSSFTTYYSFLEAREVAVTIDSPSADQQGYRIECTPKGARRRRRLGDSFYPPRRPTRVVVLKGWGHPPPPNPRQLSRYEGRAGESLRAFEASLDWKQRSAAMFSQYVRSLSASVVVDFPLPFVHPGEEAT
jgi:hypothetical protein